MSIIVPSNHTRIGAWVNSCFLHINRSGLNRTTSNIIGGCQYGTWSPGQKKIRGTSTKLQREQNEKQKKT